MSEPKLSPTELKEFVVVCVDDQVDILKIQTVMIESLGLRVEPFDDPANALEYIRLHAHIIALVISDYNMPRMNGFDLRKKILEFDPSVPFVVLSGFINKEMALQGIDLKISGFLDKPFQLAALTNLVSKEVDPRISSLKDEKEMLDGFTSEAADLVEQCEQYLLELENNPTSLDSLNRLFGCIHTLKGASSFFNPKTLHKFAHRYEDYLKQLQKGEIKATQILISSMLEGLDTIRFLLKNLKEYTYVEFDVDAKIESLFVNAINAPVDSIQIAAAAANPKAEPIAEKATEIKVPLIVLDEFMQLSGEMTVIRNMINKCVRSIEKKYTGDKDVAILGELLQELHKVNANVQDKISDLRKVSIRHIFKPLTRAARDVAKSLHKEIDLKFSGDDLTIDTSTSDILSKVMLHLVKNGIDHGFELPAERVAKGKPAQGTLEINARVQNENVVIEIKDDGRGINEEALKKKALQSNLYTAEELARMEKGQIHRLIFESGLSTAAAVTEVSGRGVGMSMVKDTIEEANGSIEILSTMGEGTCMSLILPIPQSVLITDCLFIGCSGQQFGLQQRQIYRVLKRDALRADQLMQIEGTALLNLDEELIPVLSLAALVGIEPMSNKTPKASNLIVVQAEPNTQKIALAIDDIYDIEDTVVKPVLAQINLDQVYLGATFLDDGTVGLILDTAGLIVRAKIEAVKKSKQVKDIEASLVVPVNENLKTYLTFNLSSANQYAISQANVYRIETIFTSSVTQLGKKNVFPYRGEAIPLINLADGSLSEEMPASEEMTLVLVHSSSGIAAIQVSAVTDFVTGVCDSENSFHPAISGTLLLETGIVSVLEVDRLVQA